MPPFGRPQGVPRTKVPGIVRGFSGETSHSDAITVSGDASGTLTLTSSADAVVLVQGAGAGTLTLGETGAGSVLVQGAGSGTLH